VASINYATREISCKIVYYGPGLSGKTTNLQIIHRKIPDKDKSEMVSLATETDRTLFFDFLPLDLGSIKGFNTKFQLYTVPGQVYYNATRKLVLRGVDGVVFVVDSQVDKLQENLESFANLQENLREYGHSIENIPLVLQYNKRDLPNVYPVEQLNSLVNKYKLPYYEAVAATGVGVFTTLKAIGKSVIDKFNAKYAGFQGTRRPAPRPDAAAAPAAAPRPPGPPAFGQPAGNPAGQPFPGGFGSLPGQGPANQGPGAGGQPFPARPVAPGMQTPQQRAPLNVPQSPGGFSGPPGGFGSPPGPAFGTPAQGGFGGGFPAAPGNPFGGNPHGLANPPGFPGAGAPMSPAAPGGFNQPGQGFGMGGSNPFAQNKPGFPPDMKPPMGGPANPGLGGQGPGPIPGLPQQMGNMGFTAPPGIPVSPFVETFAGSKPAPPTPPPGIPGMPPLPINPFSGGAGGPPSFAPKPMPLGGAGSSLGGGFPSAFPSAPGNPSAAMPPIGGPGAPGGFGSSGFGGAPAGFGGAPAGFGAPKPPGQGGFTPMPNPLGVPPAFPAAPGKGGPPYPTLSAPGQPEPKASEAGPPFGKSMGGVEDNSGIVTTYEDMAKDDSFKTKKLPHPSEKKKGFFDGLFKKEK
jgi:mutual gliding-motility protein MglA